MPGPEPKRSPFPGPAAVEDHIGARSRARTPCGKIFPAQNVSGHRDNPGRVHSFYLAAAQQLPVAQFLERFVETSVSCFMAIGPVEKGAQAILELPLGDEAGER